MATTTQKDQLKYQASTDFKQFIDANILPFFNTLNSFVDDIDRKVKSETDLCSNENKNTAHEVYCSINEVGKWNGVVTDTVKISVRYTEPVYTFLKQKTGEDNYLMLKEILNKIFQWIDNDLSYIINKIGQRLSKISNVGPLKLLQKLITFIKKFIPFLKNYLSKFLLYISKHKSILLKLGKAFNRFFVFMAVVNLVTEAVINKSISGTFEAIISIILIVVGFYFGFWVAVVSIILLIVNELFKYFFKVSVFQLIITGFLYLAKDRIKSFTLILTNLPKALDKLLLVGDAMIDLVIQFFEYIMSVFQTIFEYLEIVKSTLTEAVSDVKDYAESIVDDLINSAYNYAKKELLAPYTLSL